MSAAAYAALPAAERRALHQRLAEGTDDPLERGAARRAGGDAGGPQDRRGARRRRGGGARRAARPTSRWNCRGWRCSTPSADADRAARLDLLADALVRAGDSPGAVRAQRQAIDLTPAGPRRARRRIRLAEMATEVIGWGGAAAELQAAAAEAAADPVVRSEALLTLAAVTDDIDLADASAAEAVALLEAEAGQPDPAVMSGRALPGRGGQVPGGPGPGP